MPNLKTASLNKALALSAGGGLGSIPDTVFAAIADRLERAINSGNRQLADIEADLSLFFDEILRAAPAEVRTAIREGGSSAGAVSFLLGRASFAQLLASRVKSRRADETFHNALTDPRFAKYVRALMSGPKNGKALEQAAREAAETVSRKLSILRGLGVVDSLRDGNSIINRLTPAALVVLQQMPEEQSNTIKVGLIDPQAAAVGGASEEVARIQGSIKPFMRNVQPFRGRARPRAGYPGQRAA